MTLFTATQAIALHRSKQSPILSVACIFSILFSVALLLGVLMEVLFFVPNVSSADAVYCPQLSQTLQQGAHDASTVPAGQVTELQKFLASYYSIDQSTLVTGYFGAMTQKYATQFQSEQKLPAQGLVGSRTRAAIQTACGASSISTITPSAADSSGSVATGGVGSGSTNASASIDSSTLTTSSQTPTLTGNAYGTDTVVVSLGNSGGLVYGSGPVSVVKHRWSVWLVGLTGYGGSTVSPGTYTVSVYDTNNVLLTSNTLTILDRQVGRALLPSCNITTLPSTVQSGQSATVLWTSQNASTASWISAGGTKGVLAGTTVIPTGTPDVQGSQSVTFPTSGFSTVALSVRGVNGDATCSGYVLVLGLATSPLSGATTTTAASVVSSDTSSTSDVATSGSGVTTFTTAAPSGSLAWSPCAVSSGATACPVTVNWISADSILNGSPQVGISIRNSAGALSFDSSGTLSTLAGAGAVNPMYPFAASANGSKSFTLPTGTYSVSLIGYNPDGSSVVLQTQQVAVQ